MLLGLLASACSPQEPPAADPRSDVQDAAGVDAEFAVQAFALSTPTLTLVTPATAPALPVGAAGAKTSLDVTYSVTNFALGQVRCYADGTFVGLGTSTTYKFANLGKGLHTLSCVLASNTGTEETGASARFVLQAKVLEPCTTASDCNDGNSCSQDACVDGQCVYAAIPNCCGSKFDCGAGETCLNPNTANSQCSACTTNADCDDNESCTTDKCELAGPKGKCINTKADPECCSKAGDLCDDGKSCTTDKCDTTTGKCTHIKPDGVCCSDTDCVLSDPCLVAQCVDNECRTGPDKFKPGCCSDTNNPTCNDNNFCTIDACDVPQSGGWKSCSHKTDPNKPGCCTIGNGASNDQCDDGQPCTWDYCHEFQCKNIKTAECCETTLDCDDNNPCTADKCTILPGDKAGTCSKTKVEGCCVSVADCDDNKFCTTDSCNYSAFSCKNVKPDPSCCDTDAECDDGKFCTVKVCVNHQCLFGPDKFKPGCCDSNADCNDGKACTIDTCDTATHQCKSTSNGDPTCCNGPEDCDDADCTTIDYCDGFNKCKHGPAPDKCKADLDCDDGNPCSADKCAVVNGCGSCEHSEVPAAQCCQADFGCNDNNPCTTDKCDVATGKCSYGVVSNCCKDDVDAQTACNDNNACTIEYCVGNQCRNTAPKNGCCASNADCNDADSCTTDSCANIVSGKGACQFAALSGCTAGCDPSWSAEKLSDGNVCTVDQCVLVNGTYKVTHAPIPSCCIDKFDCDDNLPCTFDYCIFNECVHQNSEAGQTLCCSKETEATDCGYLNSPCATGQCVDQTDGSKKCEAVEKPVCTVNLSYCQDFESSGTVKQLGWNPTDLNGTASSNWGIASDGGLGPDKYARLTWTPTKNNFHTCLQSPVIQAAGAQAVTVQFDREFTPALGDATLTIRGSLDGEVVDWSKSTIIDGPLTAASQLGPDTLTIKLPPELSGSNGLRLAFCVASSSTLNIDQFAVDNVCIAKGTAPSAAKCPPNQTVSVGSKVSVPIKVTDPDVGDIVSFQVLQAPSFVKASSALYYWLDGTWNTNVTIEPLSLDDVGDHEVVVRYTDGFLFGTCTFKITVTYSGGYLIFKPSEVPLAQAQTLKNALEKKGQFGQITSDISLYNDLTKFFGIFVLLGVYPDNHVLQEGEVAGLKAYLSSGGKVYLEGGDTFMFDKPTTLHPFFKIKGILESSPAGVTGPLKGSHVFADASTTPATPYVFGYSQDWAFNNLNDQIEGQISVAKTKNILRNDGVEKYWVAVGHDNPTAKYRTIGSSVLFSGIETLGGGTQDLFLERILSFWANGFADCTKDTDCNDDNTCTTDTCDSGVCSYSNACLCSAQSDLKCGDALVKLVTNGGGATQATANYSCDGATAYQGKEAAYSFVSPTSKPVTLTLTNVTNAQAKLFVLKASAKGCDPSGCIASTAVTSGGATVSFAASANVQYFIVVDVPGSSDSSQFDLAASCSSGEDCKNGVDDNGNGKTDCADTASCCGDSACAGEICNGADDNCDGTVDEGCDDDGDGWCDTAMTTTGKPPVCPSGTGDCNDGDGTINPGQAELCSNNKDDNCSGAQDEENASGCTNYFTDLDGDAFGAGNGKCLCAPSGSFKATKGGDCNDAKALINPQVQESCSTSDDDNCNGSTNDADALGCQNFYTDLDGDLYGTSPFKCQCVASGIVSASKPGDCVDTNAGVNPAVSEICNGLDDNCNGTTDETCDDDGDGFCDGSISYSPQSSTSDICGTATDGNSLTLTCPSGGVISAIKFAEYGTVTGTCPSLVKGSCDASNEIAYISGECMGKSSCSTSNWLQTLGDPCPGTAKTMGVIATCSFSGSGPLDICPKGPGDSDDTDSTINPEGEEICDAKDNNSDGQTDDGCDDDKDGYCDASIFTLGKPVTCPMGGGDCTDTDAKVNPGMVEDCATADVDENCNGSSNDLNALGCTPLFFDGDLDNWGTNASKCLCGPIGQYNAINPGDCNDDNKNINPGVDELCDDIDNDCDKVVDNGCDDDGDGYCDTGMTLIGSPAACINGKGDCNDADAQVNPAKAEVCGDGKDNNCNGNTNDVGAIGCTQYYTDQDGDTYGSGSKSCLCQASGTTSATNNADCADADDSINPATAEKCDGKDNNCDGSTDEGCDDDKDGYCDAKLALVGTPGICPNGGGDCDDNSDSVYKGKVAETCDGKDDDCNGSTDNGCDDDKDGYCDAAMTVSNPAPAVCLKGAGDCDDLDNTVMPGAKEVCGNFKDDNCNGSQNDEGSIGCTTLYYDGDGDNYGIDISKCYCGLTGKFTSKKNGDCDDTAAAIAPGATEKCDGVDNDCDSELDEAGATGCSTYYYDEDKDGYGLNLTKCLCGAGSPFTASQAGDCNDTNADMAPSKTEVCDNLDNNCNTQVDESCNADGDKYCGAGQTVVGLPSVCPLGGGDCADSVTEINPSANEVCNGKDDNCNGNTDEGCDNDGDGYCDADMVTVADNTQTAINEAFSSGASGWSMTTTTTCGTLGGILGGYNTFGAGAKTSKTVNLNAHKLITIEFDFIKIDGWDGESGQLWLDGQLIWSKAYTNDQGSQLCGSNSLNWNEFKDHIKITVAHSASTAKIEFTSTLDQTPDDESWGVDNVLVTVASAYPATCPKGAADCNDTDAAINPEVKEVCGNSVDENCSGGTNDAGAVGCKTYYVDFDGDGYGKGGTTFQKVLINEFRRAGNFTNDEYIELLVAADVMASDLDALYFGDSSTSGAGKNSSYRTKLVSAGINEIKAGTLITIGGSSLSQDLSYDPAGGDWNITLQIGGSYVTVSTAGGDFAADDVAWIDTSKTGTTSIDSIRWGSANGSLGSAAKVVLASSPANGSTGVVLFTSDISGLNQASNYKVNGTASVGQPNGDANSTFVQWLRTTSLAGNSQCLCVADNTYKVTQPGDCNDANLNVFSGATELCDGLDNNCSGVIDEGCDNDGDGYCDLNMTTVGTPPLCPNGGGDCDDNKSAINPGAQESCSDGVDTNCDGELNSTGGTGCVDYYYDGDGDGIGANIKQCMCTAKAPFNANVGGDCDDTKADVKPGVQEDCATPYDDNCNGDIADAGALNCLNFYTDADKDGFGTGSASCRCVAAGNLIATVAGDCNDSDGNVNPGKTEMCDGKDNNCNANGPAAVEANAETGVNNSLTNYIAQEVKFSQGGTLAKVEVAINAPNSQSVTMYVFKGNRPSSLTGQVETIGPVAVSATGTFTKYTFTSVSKPDIAAGEQWVFIWKASSTGVTIQESSANAYTKGGAFYAGSSPFTWTGLGSGGGTNVAGTTDVTFTAYMVTTGGSVDEGCNDDGDGYCDANMDTVSPAPAICSKGGGDCDDNSDKVNKDVAEVCDDLDNNCNGNTDEQCDADLDGWCNASKTVVGTPKICSAGKNDCDDGDKNVYPGKAEMCDDADNNCNGSTDEGCDGDGDQYCTSAMATVGAPAICTKGGNDCADDNVNINPGVAEECDGKDNNCIGGADETCSDLDQDGYCNGDTGIIDGCPKGGGDCNDSDAAVNPGAAEVCSTPADDNCDGTVNAEGAQGCTNWYVDADFDGYGGGTPKCQCFQTVQYSTAQGGDCKDNDKTVGPGQIEICDGLDNDCKAGVDDGCDDDNDSFCDSEMQLKDTATCLGSLQKCKTGLQWPPIKGETINMDTHSHGGGYHPYFKEYWYPEWAGPTIYRYDSSYKFVGTTYSGQYEVMGLAGDTQSPDYFTANWGYFTVTRRSDSSTVWTYNLGYYAGGVYADDNFVYAMRADNFTLVKLNKDTGKLIESINLKGSSNGNWMLGALGVAGDYVYVGTSDGNIYSFDMTTKKQVGSYNTGIWIYNAFFDGNKMCVSSNNSQVTCFMVFGKVCEQLCSNSLVWPPKKASVVGMETYSHGGGYSPKYKEFWYPSWNGSTVHRYNSQYQEVGTFDSGQNNMMQLWGDTDGSYYTANSSEGTITKKEPMGSQTLWTYKLGMDAGAVAADNNYVYAMGSDSMEVTRLDKSAGQKIDSFYLSGGGSETIYGGLATYNNFLLVGRGSGTVYRYDLSKMTDGAGWPPSGSTKHNMYTYSHGGGYSPKYKEFWYPNWSSTTIFRYNSKYEQIGSFESGRDQIMQLWGEADGTYYTANWGHGSVSKWGDMNNNQLWETYFGQTMAGVTSDANYVYAMANWGSTVWRLNKENGSIIDSFNLNDGPYWGLYGGLAVVDGKILIGRDNATLYRYDLESHSLLDTYGLATSVYNMAFTGTEYCISDNGSNVWCYRLSGKSVPMVDSFQTASNIYNMAFTGTEYCVSANNATVYCYTSAGEICKKGNDCDDTQAAVKPGFDEICDGQDNNCDTLIDDGCDDDNDNYCDKNMTVVGTPPTCSGGGGDCDDTTSSLNPAPSTQENCSTNFDDNCDGSSDQLNGVNCTNFYYDGDSDGQGIADFQCRCAPNGKYSAVASGDCDDADPTISSGNGIPKPIKGVYRGSPINMDTRSHGGGFSPQANEYWYPEWAGNTIYRYNSNFQSVGTFTTGQGQIMQLWGDKDGSYYTANWGYNSVSKYSGMDGELVWQTNIGNTAGGVTADANYVYAMPAWGMYVWVLDKTTGEQVNTINLGGGYNGSMYGGLAIVGDVLYVGRDNGTVYMYDVGTGDLVDEFQTATNIYNMAFNGTEYCVSSNSNQVHCYKIVGSGVTAESCDGKDNNCNGQIDETCDVDKDGYCDAKLKVTSNVGCPKSVIQTTDCIVPANPPVYKGAPVNMDTRSHGGGYSPKYKEYWYPEWAGTTIYRYNSSYQFVGTFNSGQNQMMQLWGDIDGTYYTANWGYNTVTKKSDMGSDTLWTWYAPGTTSAVTADTTYVYAMMTWGSTVYVLDKIDGNLVKTFNLSGGSEDTTYGGLAAVNGMLFVGRWNGVVHRYNIDDGQLVDQFSVETYIYNMAFNGKEYCISPNSSQVFCYSLTVDKCNFGDDCDDKDTAVNAAAPEICDSKDNNCNKDADEGCDDDGDGYCDMNMVVVGTPAVIKPGTYVGKVINMETYSHGGGYSPKYQEYWYPQWAGNTIYRFNKSHQQVGSFNTGMGEIMQLWGDTDGSYYTANWGYSTINKWSDMNGGKVWSFNIGSTASGVAADADYVYAMRVDGTTVWVLDKATGQQVNTINLSGGGNNTTTYGGLAVTSKYIFVGRWDGNVYYFDKTNGSYVGQFNTANSIYNSAFNGKDYCVSANSNQVYCYTIETGGCQAGGGDCKDTAASVNPAGTEICDGQDNDCNGQTDEPNSQGCSAFYYDGDQDGVGVNSSQCLCSSPKEFKVVSTPATWQEAEEACIAWGGDLATIDNNGDNTLVRDVANAAGVTGNIWIGLTDVKKENAYVWTDGSGMSYSNWDSGEPAGEYFTGTTVLDQAKQKQLNAWAENENQKWTLCYRGTTDGFNSNTFHNKCDSKKGTLSILRDTSGNVFGGYNSGTWAGYGGYYNPGGTWLFSFKNNYKSDWGGNCAGQNYGTYNHPSYGPTFGGGHDLYVDWSMKTGYTYFGYSYYCPVGSCGNWSCMTYLASDYSGWQLDEVEVYYKDGLSGGVDNNEDYVLMKGNSKWADVVPSTTAAYVCTRSNSLFSAKTTGDCDDSCPTCTPNKPELCDGSDNNCNGIADEGCDDDDDDFCDGELITVGTAPTCSKGGGDCNDENASVKPGVVELCNNYDENCNSITDENASASCPNGSNVTYKCVSGACQSTCAVGTGNCNNDMVSDGCETNLLNSVSHCGACGVECSSNNLSSPTCSNGVCGGTCNSGFGDCNKNLTDGCETNFSSNSSNCGGCGNKCGSGQSCQDGSCKDVSQNEIVYNGYAYRTLDDAPPSAGYGSWINTCQNGNWVELPAGYELAPEDSGVVANVIAQNIWSTHCILFSNGVSYGVQTYNGGGGCGCYGSDCMSQSGNSWIVTSCSRRILIRRQL